ncbi:MAG: V-type ATP synthase subunit I [candidate division WOR-3 bacterium]|nr:V-type ATP synthase subunit I [candidate division WOR-3 bacterium]
MAIAPVKKILIAVHKSEEKIFLDRLQELGILHIVHKAENQESIPKTTLQDSLNEIASAIEYLNNFTEKPSFLSGIATTKTEITSTEYLSLAQRYDINRTLNRIKQLRQKISILSNQQKTLLTEINILQPWQNLRYNLTEIYTTRNTEIILGQFSTQIAYLQTQDALKDLPVYIEIVHQEQEILYAIIAYPKEIKETIRPLLTKFEIIDLSKFQGYPQNIINDLSEQINVVEKDIEATKDEVLKLVSELPKLQILYDYYYNLKSQEEVLPLLQKTNEVIFIEGWIKQKDFKKLEEVINSFKTAVMTLIVPNEGEEPPVALENRSIFKPFEIILELYTMPKPIELDPTPLLAPFFAVFFALCLTDAGYGIILLILALLLLKKMKTASKFLTLLAICGGFTIFAGAITGGWFGDIVDKLGLQFLVKFRDQLLLFDPIKNPMPFFILSIVLGYIHLNYGILIEIYDSFRQKNWQTAVFEQLPWLLFLNGLIIYVFTGRFLPITTKPFAMLIILMSMATIIAFTRRIQKLMLHQTLWAIIFLGGLIFLGAKFNLFVLPRAYLSWNLGKYLILIGLIALSILSLISQISQKKTFILPIIIFVILISSLIGYFVFKLSIVLFLIISVIYIMLSADNRKLIKNIIWGLYNLYGATSFLGIVLSYIRLMALGMVTAGIAMAINTIAWMVIKIPIIGIVLAIIFMLFGHAYNLAINILGAFVHSLRLNYVEFFPRFFTGGGEKFSPFQRQTKYVTIK